MCEAGNPWFWLPTAPARVEFICYECPKNGDNGLADAGNRRNAGLRLCRLRRPDLSPQTCCGIANVVAPIFADHHRWPDPRQSHRGIADVPVQRGRWLSERLAPATFGLAVIVGCWGDDGGDDRGRAGRPDHPGCLGLYSDANEAALEGILATCRRWGNSRLGIQLAHAGRKASVHVSWQGGKPLSAAEGAWQCAAASPIAFDDHCDVTERLTLMTGVNTLTLLGR